MQALQRRIAPSRVFNSVVKIGITAGLLLLIFNNVDPGRAWKTVSLLSPATLLAVLALQLSSSSIAAYRWYLIMRKIGTARRFVFFLQSYFKGAFFNQGLPTSIGGDAVRIMDCTRGGHSALDGFYGVFIDRFVGLAGLLILNIVALLFSRNIIPTAVYYPLLAILVLLFTVLVILLFVRRIGFVRNSRWLGFLGQLSQRYYQVYATPASVVIQLGLSVIIHLLAMIAFYILGTSVGLTYPFTVYLALVPPVVLLTILPLSLAGWGIREGAMIGFFLLVGADRTRVLSFSILYGLLALASSLPGLFVYLAQKNRL